MSEWKNKLRAHLLAMILPKTENLIEMISSTIKKKLLYTKFRNSLKQVIFYIQVSESLNFNLKQLSKWRNNLESKDYASACQ